VPTAKHGEIYATGTLLLLTPNPACWLSLQHLIILIATAEKYNK